MSPICLKLGDTQLDTLMAMDEEPGHGGIEIDSGDAGAVTRATSPIILIVGEAGTGKTTLALQMCRANAREGKTRLFYYSLEQTVESLRLAWRHFRFSIPNQPEPFLDFAEIPPPKGFAPHRIHLCHFAPLPVDESEPVATAFEDRFRQLNHLLKRVAAERLVAHSDRKGTDNWVPVFFIDSLDAIATTPLRRNDIYRLFELFRSRHIPMIVTAERHQGGEAAIAATDAARFLADIVIDLAREEEAGHLQFRLGISKSRVRRQALGLHIYKIRTDKNKTQTGTEHAGLVVYPSIPCMLSQVRARRSATRARNVRYRLCSELDREISRIMEDREIKASACFSIMGPPGTHKLALSMNLATGAVCSVTEIQEPPLNHPGRPIAPFHKLLIVSFGGTPPMDLGGVAWFKERLAWRQLTPQRVSRTRVKSQLIRYKPMKLNRNEVYRSEQGGNIEPQADLMTFRIGHLTPEECFHRIREVIEQGLPKDGYSAVLVSDTAQICTGFPLLRRDPLFLPALIDLFKAYGIASVCIGVNARSSLNRDMDLALQSCADYRISLSHYPSRDEMARRIVMRGTQQRLDVDLPFAEQMVSVVVDNVTGKHYGRTPNWLWVEEQKSLKGNRLQKRLCCGDITVYLDWIRARSDARKAPSAGTALPAPLARGMTRDRAR